MPKVIAKDIVLNCQPHPAFPKRPSLFINLFFYLSFKKEVGKARYVSGTVFGMRDSETNVDMALPVWKSTTRIIQ